MRESWNYESHPQSLIPTRTTSTTDIISVHNCPENQTAPIFTPYVILKLRMRLYFKDGVPRVRQLNFFAQENCENLDLSCPTTRGIRNRVADLIPIRDYPRTRGASTDKGKGGREKIKIPEHRCLAGSVRILCSVHKAGLKTRIS